MVFDDPKFKCWKRRIEANGNILKNIEVLATISRDKNNLLVAFLDCRLLTPEGVEIPRYIAIRGESVVIVPMFTCPENKEIYTLMVKQHRIGDGDYNLEFPAGSTNSTEDDLKVIALQELQEELHINVSPEELRPLASGPISINPGLSDDSVYFFYFERKVPLAFLKEMDGRKTGCPEDCEYISVKLLKMSEVSNILNSSALIGVKLLERALNRVF